MDGNYTAEARGPAWRRPPRISEGVSVQLELDLYPDTAWGGIAPRALTRGHLGLILTEEGKKSTSGFECDPNQLELFPVDRSTRLKERPREAGAFPFAPTLLPLPWEV